MGFPVGLMGWLYEMLDGRVKLESLRFKPEY